MFIDCSKPQPPNQPTKDLPMTTTYESTGPSSTPSDAVYTAIEKPEPEYEKVDAATPVYSN